MWYSTEPETWFKCLMNGRYRKGHTPANKGKKWSDYMSEDKQAKIRAAAAVSMLGKRNPNAGRKGKPIVAIKEGKRRRFDSIALACTTLGICRWDIMNCIKGRQKTTHGYRFIK